MFEIIYHYSWSNILLFYHGATASSGPRNPHYRGFTITLRHTTLGRTPLDKWSAGRRDLYLATHNTHKIPTSMPPAGFEPTFQVNDLPQTHALDRATTGISSMCVAYCCLILGPAILGQYSNLQPTASGRAWKSTEKMYCGKYDKIRHKQAHIFLTISSTLRSNN